MPFDLSVCVISRPPTSAANRSKRMIYLRKPTNHPRKRATPAAMQPASSSHRAEDMVLCSKLVACNCWSTTVEATIPFPAYCTTVGDERPARDAVAVLRLM